MILNKLERLEECSLRNATQNTHLQQPALFDLPPNKTGQRLSRSVKPHGKRYLQDCLWKESLLAVKLSLGCQGVGELITNLRESLTQNSIATRERNTSIILSRFFPTNDLDQLPRRVLHAYGDEILLTAVMRVLFLEVEPLIGRLVTERLFTLPPGTPLSKDFFAKYVQESTGREDKHIASRCSSAVRALGWIVAEKRKFYVAQQILNETAALLIFHHYYAPMPRVIDVKLLLSEPIWKYAGFGNEDEVREFMRKLERRGLVSRYAIVDRLEQVTTRYSLDSLIDRKVRV